MSDLPNTSLQTEGSSQETSASANSSSRRQFLQSTIATGAVATGSVASTSFLSRSANAAGSDLLKVGLIGCGGRGTGAAENALKADSGTILYSAADMFKDRLDLSISNLKRNKGIKDQVNIVDDNLHVGWDGYKNVIDSCDVVLLCTPPHFRPMHLEYAIEAGKQIFCEKPVATDMKGVRKVLELSKQAEAKGLNLVSGLCWRYDLGVKETIQKIKDGAIGDIISIQENYLTGLLWRRNRKDDWTDMHDQLANWLYYRWLSGDHIAEQFIHSLDKSLWLHNDEPPKQCYGMGGRQCRTSPEFGDVYDHFYVVYEWADGTRTYAATRQMDGCFSETEDFIYGTKGMAKVLSHEIKDSKGEVQWKYKHEGTKPSMYDLEHIALFKAIRDGKPINNGTYMSYSTMMALMGREACYSGQLVTWDQCMKSEQDFTPPAYAYGPAPDVQVNQPGKYKFV